MTDESSDPALSFGQAADHYDQIRPSYPASAVRWALGDATGIVIDLGAGTGLMTRVLTTIATTVIPVEPDPKMRARLATVTAGVEPVGGSAESIPVADGYADAVIAAQSYHWFNHELAHAEIARVVRPGGVFAPIWNIRDESVPWVLEYSKIIGGGGGSRSHNGWLEETDFGPGFGPVEQDVFHHAVTMDAVGLVDLLMSRSYYLTASPADRTRLHDAVRELATSLGPTFDLPYQTVCYRAVRHG